MRVPILLPHHDVEHIGCPSCGQPADLSNSPRRRRREWTCPTCRAAGTIRIAGHYAAPDHPHPHSTPLGLTRSLS